MPRLLIIGLGFIFLGGALLLYAHIIRPKPTSEATDAAAALAPIIEGRYQETGALYSIVANYPTTTPLAGTANDAALEAMQGWVIETVGAFKDEVGSSTDSTASASSEQANALQTNSSLTITYSASSSPTTLSYLFTALKEKRGTTSTATRAFSFPLHP